MNKIAFAFLAAFLCAGCRSPGYRRPPTPLPPPAQEASSEPAAEITSQPSSPRVQAPGPGETVLELKTEDLTARKVSSPNGSARIRKYVVSENVTVPVELRRDEFSVERIPASGTPTTPFGEGEVVIDIPLTIETVSPMVTPRVIEIIRVRKGVEIDQRSVSATLRTEKVDIQKTGP